MVFVTATNAVAHLSSTCVLLLAEGLQRMGSVAHCRSVETGWHSRMQLTAQEMMVPGEFTM